jgi:hypothetical protein
VVNPATATACIVHLYASSSVNQHQRIALWIFPRGKMGAVWLHSLLSQTVFRIALHACRFLQIVFLFFFFRTYHTNGDFILPNGYTVD